MSAIKYSLQDLRRSLSSLFVERGQQYARLGRVQARDYDARLNHYAGSVEGSRPEPYRIDARVIAGRTGVHVYGTCTCPMRVNCKHVAAVLVDALARGGRGISEHPAETQTATQPEGARPIQRPAPANLPLDLSLWLDATERAAQPQAQSVAPPKGVQQRLLYLVDVDRRGGLTKACVRLLTARVLKAGGYSDPRPWAGVNNALYSPPRFVLPEDQRIVRMLQLDATNLYNASFALSGSSGPEILRAVLATGRCHLLRADTVPLRQGAARNAVAGWAFQPDASQQLVFRTEPPADAVLPLAPPWYVDSERNECGPIESGVAPALAEALACAPLIAPEQAAAARDALSQRAAGAAIPLPQVPEETTERRTPRPHLHLSTEQMHAGGYRPFGYCLDLARLSFDYGGVLVSQDSSVSPTLFRDGKVVRVVRDRDAEKRANQRLRETGLKAANGPGTHAPQRKHDYTFYDAGDWLHFVGNDVPRLRAAGWQVEIDGDFRFQVAPVGEWYAEVEESGRDWFDLDLGVLVDGKKMPLLPILVEAVRARPDLLGDGDRRELTQESIMVQLADGRFAPIPVTRIQPLLSVLHELLDQPASRTVRLPRLDAVRLADLDEAVDLSWRGGEKLRELGARLASFQSVAPVEPPRGLCAQLRPYQAQGLAWLQFLRDFGLCGILADDMGLGKTVQALAHILVEKEAGRLDRPALVVCPTSLVPNWKAEAARFAPGLRVHVSHGLKRKASFDQMAAHDLVITTYPLLARDKDSLLAQPFHLAILDEAQQIKNAQTLAAKVVVQLEAQHRLCLTGTPLENHLGELWSLFHFLMPGFLGDTKTFRQLYRNPIEKQGDDLRRASLVRRLRPFVLRRIKEQVAKELPSKTEIVLPVELEGAQRDLYETVRASMDERVRREIAARGLQRSQIIVLDALLKLRQTCCDPRLLKLDSARKVKESAKLEALIELLEELLPGGHRVLMFSQFTSMLELIEPELAKRDVRYVKLTGETRDRAKPVKLFQSGEVPLFLISLKAGGTGLNLTAADTVIHYDPWWNPAVENQATDRTHRIGQDKPVFVYKLIVSGSVEEKIARLQAAKAALAKGVLGEGEAAAAALTAKDIAALFEPLG